MRYAVNVVILNNGLGVRKVILRVNLRQEASRMKLSIGTSAEQELFDVEETGSGNIEMNVVAAESRRKRDILRDLQRFGLIRATESWKSRE